ncbi:peptidylprolyl isomerase [Fusibacter ferrireducens]|uniref:Peptidylprolyl isomerase n=1 Tax=Fusibacter ferrireducens TaxID=2785058 RepID=A0ABR9ZVC7_9FIRM|nr:peptidylprolyl isomerase [Fusibacter ferrireducens]MBF4694128.1 peptidylprolyl isomerase [Fusibacter ferrireducens]
MSKVLVKVNGREITENDLNAFFATLGQQVQGQFQGEQGKARLLDELVYQELFYAEAVESDVENTPAFKAELDKMKESLLKQFNIKALIDSVEVTEEEAKAFYDANPQYFESQEQVKASHILVDTEEEAQKIKAEIDGGLNFEEAASKYSSCPSSEKGGDLGFFQKGQMVPEFEKVAFELAENVVSEPVKTQFGYHIIVKKGTQPGGVQELPMVINQIMQQLLIQKQNEAYLSKVEALKSKYTIERF